MKIEKLKQNLQESYNNQALERDKLNKDAWKQTERETFLSYFIENQATTILEIGAGTGQDSLFFQEHGLNPTATDMSSEMVRLCSDKGLTAMQMDFYNLTFPAASFDAVLSLNCLLHVPKQDLGTVLDEIRKVLKKDGLFYFGVYGGFDSEQIWEEDTYEPKRFFSFHTDDAIQMTVSKYFDILYFKKVDYGSTKMHFQSMILRKS